MKTDRLVRMMCAVVAPSAASLAFAAGQAQVAGNAAVNAGVVQQEAVPVFRLEAFVADDIIVPPTHPPIELIEPIRMPNPEIDIPDRLGGPGNVWVYDAELMQIVEVPMPWDNRGFDGPGGTGGGFVGADGIDTMSDLFGPRGFGTMFQLTQNQISTFPFRMNVKLVQEYTDAGNGNRSYFVCSGGMQDPEVVLTAGHCVYNRDNDSTGNDFGFASRVWVYPGWDGNGLVLGNPGVLQHYGWADSTFYAAWTGYTVDGNFDWDMGLVRLNRAVGMLTGWYGWAWGGDCTAQFYNNPSFPSEACGQTGLHNGRDMYNWNGNFDSCPGNQMRINTTAGCFTALWGGQSGSNAYYFSGDTRVAHGVASNSNRTTIGQYTKMWEQHKNYMEDTFKPAARGSTLDLQALQCRINETTITAGQTTSGATVQIPNPTNNNPASRTYNYTVYLSTNNNISAADTVLSNQFYTFDYAAMQNLSVNMVNVTIPKNTPTGTYWLGIELDPGTDADDSNNDTDLWDAHQLFVNGIVDIVANSCSAPDGTVYHNENMTVGYSVTNEGGNPSTAVTLDFYASTNTIISAADTLLGSVNIGTFAGSQTKNGNINLNIPTSLLGNYYIGYIATLTGDSTTTNNTAYDSVPVTVAGRADLQALSMTVQDSSVSLGCPLPLQFQVRNLGTVASGAYTVEVRASTNTIISTADTLLGTFNRPSLGVGSTSSVNTSVTVPAFISPGLYYIGMIVAPGLNENSTGNNTNYDPNRPNLYNCLVDSNNDCILDLLDIVNFVTAFSNQQPYGDFTGNGIWDLQDIVGWVTAFQNGCP